MKGHFRSRYKSVQDMIHSLNFAPLHNDYAKSPYSFKTIFCPAVSMQSLVHLYKVEKVAEILCLVIKCNSPTSALNGSKSTFLQAI